MSMVLVPLKRGNRLFGIFWICIAYAVISNTYERYGFDWLLFLEVLCFLIPILISIWPTEKKWKLYNDLDDIRDFLRSCIGISEKKPQKN